MKKIIAGLCLICSLVGCSNIKVEEINVSKDYEYYIRDFSEGMAIVSEGGVIENFFLRDERYGYINEEGKEIIPCIYEEVEDFSEGLASVKKDGKWGYINKDGKEIIPFIYDSVRSFSEGLASVEKNGKVCYTILN